MADSFTLKINYRGEELIFPGELRITGYTHKIAIVVENTEILFEPDEEGNYRALLSDSDMRNKSFGIELLQLIATELESTLK